jgi:cytochrome c oxidase subunit 4
MATAEQHEHAHEHPDPLMAYLAVFVALLVLLACTVGAYYIPFEKWFGEEWGFLNTMLALIIATIKASLVMLVFMHLRHSTRLTWVVAVVGFVFLCIMITFTFSDYLTRNTLKQSDSTPVRMVTHMAEREQYQSPIP